MSAASILLVVSIVSQVGALPDPPQRDRTPKPTGTASISGRVVSADSGLPLRRAHVSITGPTFRSTDTDAEGRYSLTGLTAGAYWVSANAGAHRGGYLAGGYGTTLAQGPWGSAMTRGRPIEVADRAHLTNIDIRLERAGAIAGRVIDPAGEPITRIQVRVIRVQRGLRPATVGSATTDDLGAFRIFGLQPGEYVVAADSRLLDTSRSGDGQNTIGFAPTYAPATTSLDHANRIRVTPGATATSDVQLTETRLYSISGIALTSTGDPPKSAGISVSRADSPVENVSYGASVSATGSFAVQNVPPGSYVITMRTTPDPTRPGEVEFASVGVEVGNADLEGVALLSKPGATITGQIVYDDGISERRKASITVSSSDRSSISPTSVETGESTFTLRNVFGPVVVRGAATAPGTGPLTLKAVLLDGRDITDVPTVLTSSHSGRLQVVFTVNAPVLEGIVTDDTGGPVDPCTIVVFGEDPASWTWISTSIRTEQIATSKFTVRGLREGRYRVAAIPSYIPVTIAPPDVEFLEALKKVATPVFLNHGEKRAVELRLIRFDQ